MVYGGMMREEIEMCCELSVILGKDIGKAPKYRYTGLQIEQ
jgi:hypothetical protein